jgi:hypothetical protein
VGAAGCYTRLGSPTASDDIMKKGDVLELQRFMFEREHELNDRYVNMTNHVYSHRCSDYCWKPQMIEVEYDETDPEHAQDHPGVRPT